MMWIYSIHLNLPNKRSYHFYGCSDCLPFGQWSLFRSAMGFWALILVWLTGWQDVTGSFVHLLSKIWKPTFWHIQWEGLLFTFHSTYPCQVKTDFESTAREPGVPTDTGLVTVYRTFFIAMKYICFKIKYAWIFPIEMEYLMFSLKIHFILCVWVFC